MNTVVSNSEGHRKRLKKRFLNNGLDGFLDYEIIELLLTLGTPRKDCKLMAKESMKMFGSLKKVLEASPSELQLIKGIGPSNVFGLKLFQAISEKLAQEKLYEQEIFTRTSVVADYLKKFIGFKQEEHFVSLYLNSVGNLIQEKVITIGTLDTSLVHPREVFKPAIENRSACIIVAHNHPSGKVIPSQADRNVTEQLVKAGKLIGIEIYDHLVVSKDSYFSFREEMLI
jgi:DNA repair protein RadC